MYNEDAVWCTNEKCEVKTRCWRWIGFYEEDSGIDPQSVRHFEGGEKCAHRVVRDN